MTTSPLQDTLLEEVVNCLMEHGPEAFKPVLEWLLNEAMRAERSQFLEAEPYERNENRRGYANGYKPKTLQTRVGSMQVRIPQVRGLSFYPRSLERGCRSEVALKLAVAEMYVQGVSTRRVTEITEQLCGLELSGTQVSRIAKGLDEQLEAFRHRPLGVIPFVMLDARYEKVRHGGTVRDLAVLTALGVNPEGHREVLGVSVSLSEAEVHWREFFESLHKRGLRGIRLMVSDDHSGLKAARQAVFPSVPWQRCQFHLAQNAQHYAPKQSMREELAQAVRDVFNAGSLMEAERKRRETIEAYKKKAPEFATFLETEIPEGFTVFELPRPFWKKLRTTNLLENVNKQIRARTRVAGLFPNKGSCLRLVSAVLQEIHEEWITGKRHLDMSRLDGESLDRIYRKRVA